MVQTDLNSDVWFKTKDRLKFEIRLVSHQHRSFPIPIHIAPMFYCPASLHHSIGLLPRCRAPDPPLMPCAVWIKSPLVISLCLSYEYTEIQ